jgi:hypothetical protein
MSRDTVQLKPARFYWFTPWGLVIGATIIAWRYFVTGRELRGDGDNATFLHDATTDHRGRPYEKLTRARWRRVARRWALAGVPLALANIWAVAHVGRMADLAWAYWPWGWLFIGWLAGVALVGVGWAGVRFARWWPVRQIRRELVKPAAIVLLQLTHVRMSRRKAMRLIELPPGYGRTPDPDASLPVVRVYLPGVIALTDTLKGKLVDNLGSRLGMPHATGAWTLATARAYVELTPAPLPPREVTLDSLRAAVEAAPLERPVIGAANGRRPVSADFDNDSPHLLASAGSGAGKSTLFRFLAMQRMSHGAGAIFLDFKKWSHLKWLRGFGPDRALYFHRVPEIHDALCAVMDELVRRKDLDDEDELDALRTLDVYVEEINTTMSMLREYWKAYVAEQRARARNALRAARAQEDENLIAQAEEDLAVAAGLPAMSPAIQALRYGVNLGRQFRVHFHFIGQSMSATAAGGRDTRESFRTRLLARWDAATWKMLCPGQPYIACPSGQVGLWAHSNGTAVDIVRVPYVSDVQAHEFVLSRCPVPAGHVLSRDIGGVLPGVPARVLGHDVPAPLSELVAGLPAGRRGAPTVEALRMAAHRRESTGFPAPVTAGRPGVAALYDPDEVAGWWEQRERLVIDAA